MAWGRKKTKAPESVTVDPTSLVEIPEETVPVPIEQPIEQSAPVIPEQRQEPFSKEEQELNERIAKIEAEERRIQEEKKQIRVDNYNENIRLQQEQERIRLQQEKQPVKTEPIEVKPYHYVLQAQIVKPGVFHYVVESNQNYPLGLMEE